MDACPPLEDIAAFLDDMLPVEERAHITEHLARCESCYEIFAGAVHFQEEEEKEKRESSAEDTSGRGVLPFPLKGKQDRRISRWLPLAASVVLVAGLGFLTWQYFVPPKITVAGLVETVGDSKVAANHLYEGERLRGEEELDPTWARSSFLTGSYLIDLRLSVEAGRFESTQDLLRELGIQLDALGEQDLAQAYTEEYQRLGPNSDVRQLGPKLQTLESEVQKRLAEDRFFSFGLWTEAGRLSALTRSPEFFETRNHRRFLSLAQKNVPVAKKIQEQILDELRDIERTWDAGDFSQEDYGTLARHFESIIKQIDSYKEDPLLDE